LAIFEVVSPDFSSHNGEIWHNGAARPNFLQKISWGDILLWGKFIPILAIWGPGSPHFESHSGEIWRDVVDLGLPPHAKFCNNCLRGFASNGQIYNKLEINMHHLRGNAIPAGHVQYSLTDSGEILCRW